LSRINFFFSGRAGRSRDAWPDEATEREARAKGRRRGFAPSFCRAVSVTATNAITSDLPGPHEDPFDRMLIAQARFEDTPVVTTDPVFRDYGIPVIW